MVVPLLVRCVEFWSSESEKEDVSAFRPAMAGLNIKQQLSSNAQMRITARVAELGFVAFA